MEVKKRLFRSDLSMFKSRLNVTFDWYTSTTSDLFIPIPCQCHHFTYNTLFANMGEMSNSGVEIGAAVTSSVPKILPSIQVLISFQKKIKLKSLSGTYKGWGPLQPVSILLWLTSILLV